MSSTTMSQNQEIIEAKLCAYIDGELDLEGRSEIERHLEANPQHRRLLESLKATKDLVRWLPREQAPPEVAETLNGQLERSVLLDYDGDSLRPHMWPRVLAAAAIVALTAGLAAAVYFALPKSQKNATPYAFHQTEPSTLTPAIAPDAGTAEQEKTPENIAGKAETPGMPLADLKDRLQDKTEPAVAAESRDLDELVRQVAQNRVALFNAANNAGNQAVPALDKNATVLLVRSEAPQRTQQQLVSFLDSQKILWKQAPVQESRTLALQTDITQTWSEQPAQRAAGGQTIGRLNQIVATQPSQEGGQGAAPVAGVYVARMSRDQAVLLNTTISNEGAQTVALQSPATLNESLSAQSPTTAPSAQLPATPQLQTSASISGGVNTVVPTPAPGPVTPVTPEAPPTDASASPTTQPTTQPAEAQRYELRRMRSQADLGAVARASVASPATTQPATQPGLAGQSPATQPTDLAMDVVILLQPTPPATAAAAPATQPAASAPSQPANSPATQPGQ